MDREIWNREGGKLRAQFDANKGLAEDSGCVNGCASTLARANGAHQLRLASVSPCAHEPPLMLTAHPHPPP